jgi:hypothetical protein
MLVQIFSARAGLIPNDVSVMSQTRAEFMAKWGIQSDQELRDIITVLQAVMRSQFQRLRPKWRREFGEETLQAIESMLTYCPSAFPSGLIYHDVSSLFDRNDRSAL